MSPMYSAGSKEKLLTSVNGVKLWVTKVVFAPILQSSDITRDKSAKLKLSKYGIYTYESEQL